MIHFLGVSEDSSGSILKQLQLLDGVFKETCKYTVAIVEPTEDKCMDKFFQILFWHIYLGLGSY